jgi:hypothetical protein
MVEPVGTVDLMRNPCTSITSLVASVVVLTILRTYKSFAKIVTYANRAKKKAFF